jgi:hypothetical protein
MSLPSGLRCRGLCGLNNVSALVIEDRTFGRRKRFVPIAREVRCPQREASMRCAIPRKENSDSTGPRMWKTSRSFGQNWPQAMPAIPEVTLEHKDDAGRRQQGVLAGRESYRAGLKCTFSDLMHFLPPICLARPDGIMIRLSSRGIGMIDTRTLR